MYTFFERGSRTWSRMNSSSRVWQEDLFTSKLALKSCTSCVYIYIHIYIFFYFRREAFFDRAAKFVGLRFYPRWRANCSSIPDTLSAIKREREKEKKWAEKIHRQVARKNGPKRFELRCGERLRSHEREKRANLPFFHLYSVRPILATATTLIPPTPLSRSDSRFFFRAFPFFPRRQN